MNIVSQKGDCVRTSGLSCEYTNEPSAGLNLLHGNYKVSLVIRANVLPTNLS